VVEAYLGHGAAARLWGAAGADAGGGPTGGGPAGGGDA
jgi:hypothetical protein